jgi:hypothetical protein
MSDLVPTVLGITMIVLTLALVGALASLVVLIPPIRKLGRGSTVARLTGILIIGLLSLVIGLGLYARLGAEVHYIFSTIGEPPWQRAEDPYKPAIVKEIWIRLLVPPPLQRPCYAREAVVCQRADWAAPGAADGDWGSYLTGMGICLISSLTSGLLVWLFTRKNESYLSS